MTDTTLTLAAIAVFALATWLTKLSRPKGDE